MYLLYLDDSGSVGNKEEQYFVLGGVCVPETSLRWLSYQVEAIANQINPEDPSSVEFHAAEIFRGKESPWNSLAKPERIAVIKKVLCTLDKAHADTMVFACAVHKGSFPHEDPVLKAYEEISGYFNLYLERNSQELDENQHGLVVLDKTSYEAGLQSLAITIRRFGNRWGSQLRNIVEVPLFVDPRASRITRLADHIAYAIFRRYNANDLSYYNCIENRFYQRDGVLYGLIHRQTYNMNCTCPACLTRPRRSKIGEPLADEYSIHNEA